MSQVGGYPDYKGTPYKDSDNDGIPDDWEKAHGLNANNAADAAQYAKSKSGYTNIEEYLNSLVPLKKYSLWWLRQKKDFDQADCPAGWSYRGL